jgi:hypothetical protein
MPVELMMPEAAAAPPPLLRRAAAWSPADDYATSCDGFALPIVVSSRRRLVMIFCRYICRCRRSATMLGNITPCRPHSPCRHFIIATAHAHLRLLSCYFALI